MENKKMKYFLPSHLYAIYKRLMHTKEDLESDKIKNEAKKKEENEKFQNTLKELDVLKEEQNKIIKEKEDIQKKIEEEKSVINESIEIVKLQNELNELKQKHKLEETILVCEKDKEKVELKCLGKIEAMEREANYLQQAKEQNNKIRRMQLKYECLKDDQIYNDKGFDELIEIAKKRKDEIINDELKDFKEQKDELEQFRKKSEKRIENLREKNNCEIQKKNLELKNYKYTEYNKYLLEKEKMFNEFKKNFSANQLSNENLKNKEIEKSKMFFEQQKMNLQFREQVFNQQNQNIKAFIKQLEINDDDYSKYLLGILKQ